MKLFEFCLHNCVSSRYYRTAFSLMNTNERKTITHKQNRPEALNIPATVFKWCAHKHFEIVVIQKLHHNANWKTADSAELFSASLLIGSFEDSQHRTRSPLALALATTHSPALPLHRPVFLALHVVFSCDNAFKLNFRYYKPLACYWLKLLARQNYYFMFV